MARTRPTFAEVGDASSHTAVNTIFSDLATESAGLDVSNWAHEGLDQSSLANNAAHEVIDFIEPDSITAHFTTVSSSFVTPTIGTVVMHWTGSLVIAAGAFLLVEASGEFFSDPTSTGIPIQEWVEMTISADSGGGLTPVANARVWKGDVDDASANINLEREGSLYTFTKLGVGTYTEIAIQIRKQVNGAFVLSATPASFGNASLLITKYNRVT